MRWRFQHGHRRCRAHGGGVGPEPASLAEGYEGHGYEVLENPDRHSREMGFFPGARVRVLRNVEGEHGLVVASGHSRYVLARPAAAAIRVTDCGGCGPCRAL